MFVKFTFEEALIATQEHRYIQEAILKSSLNPSRAPPSPKESIEEPDIEIKTPFTQQQVPNGPNSVGRKKSIMKSLKSIFH